MQTGVLLKMIFHRKHLALQFGFPAIWLYHVLYSRLKYEILSLSDIRATEEPSTEVEKSPVAEKQGGEDDTTDAKKDAPVDEQEQKEAEDKV